MRTVVECRCCVPGCQRRVRLASFRTVTGVIDFVEGLCREHLRLVMPDMRALLAQVRLELRLMPCLDEFILFYRAWEAIKHFAIERAGADRAMVA